MAGLMETIEKMQCQICTLFDKFKDQQEEGIVSSITSPNNTITIGGDGSIVTVDIEESLLNLINESIQPGDNVSELVNDAGYAILADLHPVATSGSYNDLEDVPTSFPPSAHTHPISDIINLQSTLDSKENLANKGVANGYAGLDAGGKIPSSQLPNSVMELQGEWNALTNTPTLVDGVGNPGDIWKVTTAGTQNLGSGNITFEINDFATYGSNGVWFKSDNTDAVTSVFGRIGSVVALNGDYTASQITNVPFGNISAITVQTALNELDSEKAIDANVIHKTGTETKSGNLILTDFLKPDGGIVVNSSLISSSVGAVISTFTTDDLFINSRNSSFGAWLKTSSIAGTHKVFTFPNQSGTFALTSDLTPYALDANVVHKTGNESITGVKSFGADGITINNSNTAVIGIAISNSGVGIRIVSNNNANSFVAENVNGRGLWVNTTGTVGTAIGIVSNMSTTATGLAYAGQNNGTNTFTVDKLGTVAGTSFIKSGATTSNILLAGGTDIPQSTFVPSTRTININGVTQDLSVNRSYRAGLSNTGALAYTGSSVASATTINIGAVTGVITDNETTPGTPSYQLVTYAGATNITVPTIGGGTGTYVLLNSSGTIVFQNTFPTSAQRKSMIYLSKISHPNLATISFAIDEPDFVNSPLQQFRDLFQAIQYMNQGVVATGNSGLTINTTNGNIIGDGINFVLDKTNPNMLTVAAGAPRNFLLLNQSGAVGSFVTAIDPLNYDVGGVTTLIGGGTNRTTIQYLYYAPGVGFAIQRGQTVYPSLLDAVSAVGRESFIVRPNLVNNSILIAAIVLRHTTTAMNDTNFVRILSADKFGQLGGASSGISVTNLQTAYNNSLIPQITTTSALGAVTLRNGGALNTDNVFAIQNIAGTNTLTINGNGLISATNTGATITSGLDLTNNGTGFSTPIRVTNTSTGKGIFTQTTGSGAALLASTNGVGNAIEASTIGSGYAIFASANVVGSTAISTSSTGGGSSILSFVGGTGNGIISNLGSTATGLNYIGQNNGTNTFTVNKTGTVTGTSFVKSGATATNILLAGGTDIPQSTFALASGSGSYIQNQNASAQSANMWISGVGQFGNGGGETLRMVGNSAFISGYDTTNTVRTGYVQFNSAGNSVIMNETNAAWIFGTNSSERMRIAADGNVGIGTTNPQSTLHLNQSSFNLLRLTRGVVSDYEFQLGGAGEFYIKNSLTTAFPLSILNNGNVGIGTTNPTEQLHTLGRIKFAVNQSANDNGYYGLLESFNASNTGVLSFVGAGGGGKIVGGENFGTDTVIYSNTTEKIRILNNGNVGIGTSNPTLGNLVVSPLGSGSSDVDGVAVVYHPDGASTRLRARLGINGFIGNLRLKDSGDIETVYISAGDKSYFNGGNVGIGTTNPSSKLNVVGNGVGVITIEGVTPSLRLNDTTNTGSVVDIAAISGGADIGHLAFITRNTGSPTEKMRILGNGNVGIGTTNPSARLTIEGINTGAAIDIINTTASTGRNMRVVSINTGGLAIEDITGGGERLNISSSGVVKINNLSDTGTRTVVADASGNLSAPVSDESLKENIQPIHYGLNEIMKMNPVSYNFKDKEKYGEGLYLGNIAQDMEKIIPEAVFTDSKTGKMGIEYSHLHAVYIKAIQELLIRIEKLENR